MDKVIWSNNALSDLTEIAEFIEKDSPTYAQITVQKIYYKVFILETHPRIGRVVPEHGDENLRELIEGNYRIIYELANSEIQILAVHHSAKNLTFNNDD